MKPKFYRLKNILSRNAQYNMIFGERSNGKTFAVLEYSLEQYFKNGDQLAIVRRWREDFKGKRGQSMFKGVVEAGIVTKISGGRWNGVYYYASRWYLSLTTEEGREVSPEPFAYAFAISEMEHDKSTDYPRVTTVLFDEFLTRTVYLPDEFVLFMNVLSTIIRLRDNVKIFMLGNTVNKYCPYFSEMGLKHVKEMKPGDIDLYTYGDSRLTVAVEYVAPMKQGKESNFYFAFDNPKLNMITGGSWEIDIYPHCPCKIAPKDILFSFFIQFIDELLQCDVVYKDNLSFIFIHRKTTELKHPESDLIYSTEYNPLPNWRRNILKPMLDVEKRIYNFFKTDKVFYQDNEVGEVVRNYVKWCGQN